MTFQKGVVHTPQLFQEYMNKEKQQNPNMVTIFTDDSKAKNGIGAAWFNWTDNTHTQFKLSSNSSIYEAELIALQQAVIPLITIKNLHIVIAYD